MFKPKTTITGRLENSSGEWIRTTDLRVMRDFPGFGNFDRITTQISQLYVLRFRLPKQSAVGNKSSYSKSFSGGSQVLFCNFVKPKLKCPLLPKLKCPLRKGQ